MSSDQFSLLAHMQPTPQNKYKNGTEPFMDSQNIQYESFIIDSNDNTQNDKHPNKIHSKILSVATPNVNLRNSQINTNELALQSQQKLLTPNLLHSAPNLRNNVNIGITTTNNNNNNNNINMNNTIDNDNDNDNDHSHMFCGREWIRSYAWRIRQSVHYFLLYLILIILNAFVLIWEVVGGKNRKLVIILEGIITFMFVGEVFVEVITQEWIIYWKSWMNRIDFIVCILCVILFIVFAAIEEAPHSHYNVESYMDAIIVGIRYGIQAIRLIRFAHKGQQNRHMLDPENVVFDDHLTLSVLHEHGLHERQRNQNIITDKNQKNNKSESNKNKHSHKHKHKHLHKHKKKQKKTYSKINDHHTTEIEMISIDENENNESFDSQESTSSTINTNTNTQSESGEVLEIEESRSNSIKNNNNNNNEYINNQNITNNININIESSNINLNNDNTDNNLTTDYYDSTTTCSPYNDQFGNKQFGNFNRNEMEEMMISQHDMEQTQIYQNISKEIMTSDDEIIKQQLAKINKN